MPEYTTERMAELDDNYESSRVQPLSIVGYALDMLEAYPDLRAHIDAQAERIAELERDNARLREGLDKLALELREYSEQWKDEGVASVIASRVARALGNYASDVSTNKYALKDTAQ